MSGPRRTYELLATLGKGGMGTIYLARLRAAGGFSKRVALKMANADEITDEALGRLRDEARLLGLLRHRAIVAADGLIQLDGVWTVVMEYVEGIDLATVLRDTGALPVDTALEIAAEIAGALDAAYCTEDENGRPLELLHRDIKPSNILVTSRGEVKVLDFGVARADFESRESVTRDQHYGSAGYMAPERLDAIDHERSDIYSLGVVLYEMLMGERFGKASSHPDRQLTLVGERLEGVPGGPGVVELLRMLLAYAPDDRPAPRDVHRACLAAVGGTVGLHDWAENHVPALLEQRRQELQPGAPPDEEPLTESWEAGDTTGWLDGGELPAPAVPPLPVFDATTQMHRRRDETRTVVVGVAGLVFLALGAVLWLMLPTDPTAPGPERLGDPATVEPAVPAPAPARPAPVEDPDGVVDGADDTDADATDAADTDGTDDTDAADTDDTDAVDAADGTDAVDSDAGDPVGAAEPVPAAPSPAPAAPAPAPTPGATVSLVGDPARVTLVKGSRRYQLPRWVPAGTYAIHASFQGEEAVPVGQVEVPGSGKLTVSCNALFVGCEGR